MKIFGRMKRAHFIPCQTTAHNPHLELEGHERVNVRLLFGFDF
jgi:hypothetical protein